MVQQGLRLDLPSGPGCSLKYLPGSHFNPHLNTSSILGHYSGECVSCPLVIEIGCVCVCVRGRESVDGCESDTAGDGYHCTQGSRWPLRAAWRASTCRKKKHHRRRNQPDQLLFLSSSSSLFMMCSISVLSLSFGRLTLLIQTPRKREGWSFVSVNDTDASLSAYGLIPPPFFLGKGWG